MCQHIVITSHYIKLLEIIYDRKNWYSTYYKEKINIIRSYYNTIINHFGGEHALYTSECLRQKYYNADIQLAGSALLAFEQSLVSQYGTIFRSLFTFPNGKYPHYYIDTFKDIKNGNKLFSYIKSNKEILSYSA